MFFGFSDERFPEQFERAGVDKKCESYRKESYKSSFRLSGLTTGIARCYVLEKLEENRQPKYGREIIEWSQPTRNIHLKKKVILDNP